MSDQKLDFTAQYVERISSAETKLKEISHKVDDLSDIKLNLAVLTEIQKEMIEDNKMRDKERKESARAMSELSLSVKQTTEAVAKLNIKLDSTDKKLDGFIADKTAITEEKKSKKVFLASIITCLLTSATAILVAILK